MTKRSQSNGSVRLQGSDWMIRLALMGAGLGFLAFLVVLPILAVFTQALDRGLQGYFQALTEEETWSAIKLTLLTTAIALPLNTVFGIVAAWLIVKFRFPGRQLLITLIDLPFTVSPVISGLIFILLFGSQGLIGPWFISHGIPIVFATPGIVLATTFVTFPFVARELIPALQSSGNAEEEAAITLGASGFRVLVSVTLPKIKWALAYGIILCNARAMGEFGAVSVVSGHIRGLTNTVPLQVEILYNEYNFVSAFAVASLLTVLALVTLLVKKLMEHYQVAKLTDHRKEKTPVFSGG